MDVINFFIRVICAILLMAVSQGTIAVAGEVNDAAFSRPKIGLVLSGGGARGAAHVGVLKVLEENHIPVDYIAGTSFGSLIGGLYAAGYSADELEGLLKDINWQEILSSKATRNNRSFRRKQDDQGFLIKFKVGVKDGDFSLPSGLIAPNNLRLMLRGLVNDVAHVNNFDKLTIPFRAVATDLETGAEVILGKGNLASAMVASMAVPALFPPVEHDGRLLIDGGVANNLPVNVVRAMGADIVIVVDISAPLLSRDEISSFASVLDQIMTIMTKNAAKKQLSTLTEQDILIIPDLKEIGFVDFEHSLDALPKGQEAAQNIVDKLQHYSLSETDWINHIKIRAKGKKEQPVINFITVDNDSDVADRVITSYLSQDLGEQLDVDSLSTDLGKIYGTELFDEVNYSLVQKDDQFGLNIRTRRPENGEDNVRFGLALQEDFEGESGFQMAVGYTDLAINSRGGEWNALFKIGDEFGLFTEYYQPIDFADRYFIFANAAGRKFNRNIVDGSSKILSQVRISQALLQVGAGRNFGQWGALRVGMQRSFGNIRGRIGFPDDLKLTFDQTTFAASFNIDTLDNNAFPHSGMALSVDYENNLSFLNGDGQVDTVLIGGYHPITWGPNTFGINYQFGTSFGGTPDETDLFPLGGFMGLTAYSPGQLTGNHGGVVSAIYYRRVAGGQGYLAQTPLFIGATIEAGNVWNRSSDISLSDLHWSTSIFAGADTLIGPIYLGFAVGDGGQTSAFLFVGQIF